MGAERRIRPEEERMGREPRGEINPVKVVLMFLSILIAAVHLCVCVCVCVCVRQCSSAIGSLGYRGE